MGGDPDDGSRGGDLGRTGRRGGRLRPTAALVAVTLVGVLGVVLGAGVAAGRGDVARADAGHAHAGPSHEGSHHDAAAEDASAAQCQTGTPTAAETAYVEHMAAHHAQAVRMAEILRRADDVPYRVTNFADQVAVVQGGEEADMRAWLAAWRDADVPAGCTTGTDDHAGHDMDDAAAGDMAGMTSTGRMPGMLTARQLASLGRLDGEQAARRYVALMIAHHEGAVTMSEPVARRGANPWVLSLARHVVAGQASEIGAMRRMLTTL